jgi:hypothetical protein
MDKRFESINKRFEDLLKYIDKRFEDMNKRFKFIERILIVILGFVGGILSGLIIAIIRLFRL